MKALIQSWKESFRILNRRPKIMIPFLLVGIANLIAICLLYYAPQRPLSYLLGPPIETFFGERFLHYPLNFFILPKLFSYAEIIISALFGILMTAVAVGMIADTKGGERDLFFLNLLRGIKRYFVLLVTWGIIFFIISGIGKFIPKFFNTYSGIYGIRLAGVYLLLAVLVNILFIYMIPALIIKNKNIFSALKENFVALKNLFFSTIVLVFLPSLAYFPIVVAKLKTSALIEAFFPEIVIAILVVGVIVVTLIEMLITTSITLLYLNQGESK